VEHRRKAGDAPDFVAHLESDAVNEEAARGLGVRGADDDMTQFARADRFLAQDPWSPIVLPVVSTGPVTRSDGGFLNESREDLDHDSSTAVNLDCPETRCVSLDGDPESGESAGDAVHVVDGRQRRCPSR
jgi:hypothetical protein